MLNVDDMRPANLDMFFFPHNTVQAHKGKLTQL